MKTLCLVAAVLACVSAVAARTGGEVLAPVPSAELEAFLESGAHTDAEIEAMAQAEVAAVLGDSDEADQESGETEAHEAVADADEQHDVEAEALLESAADTVTEADAEMPRDTKAENARHKRLARAKARAAAAARPPVPKTSNSITSAAGGDSDIIRLVYDELKRLGSMSTPAPGAKSPASSLGVSDPRIRTLEHRLTTFEAAAAEKNYKAKAGAINKLATRLEGLDKTLAALKKAQEEQQELSARLLKATKAAETKADAGGVDYSVGYVKATLPADFDAKVNAILKSVKKEAQKIYAKRHGKHGKRKIHTPKSYPSDKGGAHHAAAGHHDGAAAHAAAAAGAEHHRAGAPAHHAAAGRHGGEAAEHHAAAGEHHTAPHHAAAAAGAHPGASMKPLPASEHPAAKEARAAAAALEKKKSVHNGKPKKLLFKPLINGHEPTPEGMRLSKALNDISIALPVTPAWALSRKEKALHDVLGESAVNPKLKAKRFA